MSDSFSHQPTRSASGSGAPAASETSVRDVPPAPWLPGGSAPGLLFGPLLDDDPVKVGDFWLDARAIVRPSGLAYLGHAVDDTPVLLVVLSEGASRDAAARDRFAGEVNKLHVDTVVARGGRDQHEGRLAGKFRSEDDDPVEPDHEPLAPWVALAYDGSPAAVAEADRLLATVALAGTRPLGQVAGPGYRLSWIDNQRPGPGRLWPLPWPGRTDRAGWITLLVSWLLVVLFAALALLIAVLLFMNSPPEPPTPPVPTTPPPSQSQSGSPPPSSGSPSSGSPSSGSPSGSPSSGSGSPSPSSASPTSGSASASSSPSGSGSSSPSQSSPGNGGEASDHPSMESQNPSGSASGPAGSTPPNKRL